MHRRATQYSQTSLRSTTTRLLWAKPKPLYDSRHLVYISKCSTTQEESSSSPPSSSIQLQVTRQQRHELFIQASYLTKSLYRTCLRSIRVIRPGNVHDTHEFVRREDTQLSKKEAPSPSSFSEFTMKNLPVDRENELSSRHEYYLAYTRENFYQESDCLSVDHPWRHEHVDRYLHMIRNGEAHRRWILNEYKFEDPYYIEEKNESGLEKFDKLARELIRQECVSGREDMYRLVLHPDDHGEEEKNTFWKEDNEDN